MKDLFETSISCCKRFRKKTDSTSDETHNSLWSVVCVVLLSSCTLPDKPMRVSVKETSCFDGFHSTLLDKYSPAMEPITRHSNPRPPSSQHARASLGVIAFATLSDMSPWKGTNEASSHAKTISYLWRDLLRSGTASFTRMMLGRGHVTAQIKEGVRRLS
jgi:hypothetical protein